MKKIRLIARFYDNKTYQQIKKILYFIKLSRISLWFLPLSVILSISHTLVTIYGVSLLFPLVQGILSQNFEHISELKGIRFIISCFPELFTAPYSLFVFLLFWIYLVNIIKNVFSYFTILIARSQSSRSTARIRHMLVKKFLKFDKSFYDKNKTAHLQDVLIKSANLIQILFKTFQEFITRVLLVTSYSFIMLKISWKLMLLSIIIFPLIIFISRKLTRNIIKISKEQRSFMIILNDKIFNMFHCMPVIRSFGQEKKELRVFNEISLREREARYKIEKLKGLMEPIDDIGMMTGVICVALAMSAIMKYDSGLSAANAFVFYYLITKILPELKGISRFNMEVEETSIGLMEMEQVLDQEDTFIISSGTKEFTGLENSIEFRNLSFKYADSERSVLNNVIFSIKKNSIVAIVGASGSGKTTIVNLLLRFYDCEPGQIFIDKQDIRSYDIASLRKKIAVVSQDALLFNDTIRNNILYGTDRQVSDEELNGLIKTLHLEAFIEKFPDKYETIVGEKGVGLSGGERQRIAIARAVIKNAPILILDEATSSLDSQTESLIIEGINSLAPARTLIIIAHRFSTIRKTDEIIYLEKGLITESGSWEELIKRQGLFYKQCISQQL